jgi:hypothetical protein
VNFQDGTSQGAPGYLPDTGAVFGDRGNGQSYGWNLDNSANARNRNASLVQDERYDTLAHMQKASNPNAVWEIAVPNGAYQVRVVSGDAGGATDAVYKINVEGVLAINSVTAPAAGQFFTGTVTVMVSDGRLTVSNASGASNNKINFIEITPSPGKASRPLSPASLVGSVAFDQGFSQTARDALSSRNASKQAGSVSLVAGPTAAEGMATGSDRGADLVTAAVGLDVGLKRTVTVALRVKPGQTGSDTTGWATVVPGFEWADGGNVLQG